jgi:hypothetical protein
VAEAVTLADRVSLKTARSDWISALISGARVTVGWQSCGNGTPDSPGVVP